MSWTEAPGLGVGCPFLPFGVCQEGKGTCAQVMPGPSDCGHGGGSDGGGSSRERSVLIEHRDGGGRKLRKMLGEVIYEVL